MTYLHKLPFLCAILVLISAVPPLHADTARSDLRGEINRGTVMIMAGSVDGTYARFAQDISNVVDRIGDLRVLPVLGKGSVQNIKDLIYLRGIDLAIVQSDVLDEMRELGFASDEIRYVTKLYDEEVHIIARQEVVSIKELAGRRVSIGNELSGSNMTARILFRALDVPVEFVELPVSEARSALINGEIEALVYVAGKPVAGFERFRESDRLTLLPLELDKELVSRGYGSANFQPSDYPALVQSTTPTISVGAVMAVYNWPEDANPLSRYQKSARATIAILDALPFLGTAGFHEKWREVDPQAQVPGWQRFKPIDQWLATRRGEKL